MNVHFSWISLILIYNTFVLLFLGFNTSQKLNTLGAKYFMGLMFAGAWWNAMVALESISLSLNLRIFWSQLCYLGIVSVPVCWLLFCIEYTRKKSLSQYYSRFLLWIVPIITLCLVATNNYHHLIWTSFSLNGNSILSGVVYHHGALFYFHMIYAYFLLFVGGILLFQELVTNKKIKKQRAMILLVAILSPWLGNIIYNFTPLSQYFSVEFTPIALAITGLVITYGIRRFQFLNVLPEAIDSVFESLTNALIVINNNQEIIAFNSAAQKIFNQELKSGVLIKTLNIPDLNLSKMLQRKNTSYNYFNSQLTKWLEISYFELNTKNNQLIGKVIQFNDISRIKESENYLSTIIDFLPDATFVIDTKGKIIIWNKAMEILSGKKALDIIGKGNHEAAIAFYNKRRPMLINFALTQNIAEAEKLYENFDYQGKTFFAEILNTTLRNRGTYLWNIARPIYNSEGKTIGAIESIRDISDSKRTEKQLQAKIKELSSLNELITARELKSIDQENQ
ncbi:MAG: histidine kinase N-terminal 7TM domain-containing protein [bacterium]